MKWMKAPSFRGGISGSNNNNNNTSNNSTSSTTSNNHHHHHQPGTISPRRGSNSTPSKKHNHHHHPFHLKSHSPIKPFTSSTSATPLRDNRRHSHHKNTNSSHFMQQPSSSSSSSNSTPSRNKSHHVVQTTTSSNTVPANMTSSAPMSTTTTTSSVPPPSPSSSSTLPQSMQNMIISLLKSHRYEDALLLTGRRFRPNPITTTTTTTTTAGSGTMEATTEGVYKAMFEYERLTSRKMILDDLEILSRVSECDPWSKYDCGGGGGGRRDGKKKKERRSYSMSGWKGRQEEEGLRKMLFDDDDDDDPRNGYSIHRSRSVEDHNGTRMQQEEEEKVNVDSFLRMVSDGPSSWLPRRQYDMLRGIHGDLCVLYEVKHSYIRFHSEFLHCVDMDDTTGCMTKQVKKKEDDDEDDEGFRDVREEMTDDMEESSHSNNDTPNDNESDAHRANRLVRSIRIALGTDAAKRSDLNALDMLIGSQNEEESGSSVSSKTTTTTSPVAAATSMNLDAMDILDVLSEIPPDTDPHSYSHLLPPFEKQCHVRNCLPPKNTEYKSDESRKRRMEVWYKERATTVAFSTSKADWALDLCCIGLDRIRGAGAAAGAGAGGGGWGMEDGFGGMDVDELKGLRVELERLLRKQQRRRSSRNVVDSCRTPKKSSSGVCDDATTVTAATTTSFHDSNNSTLSMTEAAAAAVSALGSEVNITPPSGGKKKKNKSKSPKEEKEEEVVEEDIATTILADSPMTPGSTLRPRSDELRRRAREIVTNLNKDKSHEVICPTSAAAVVLSSSDGFGTEASLPDDSMSTSESIVTEGNEDVDATDKKQENQGHEEEEDQKEEKKMQRIVSDGKLREKLQEETTRVNQKLKQVQQNNHHPPLSPPARPAPTTPSKISSSTTTTSTTATTTTTTTTSANQTQEDFQRTIQALQKSLREETQRRTDAERLLSQLTRPDNDSAATTNTDYEDTLSISSSTPSYHRRQSNMTASSTATPNQPPSVNPNSGSTPNTTTSPSSSSSTHPLTIHASTLLSSLDQTSSSTKLKMDDFAELLASFVSEAEEQQQVHHDLDGDDEEEEDDSHKMMERKDVIWLLKELHWRFEEIRGRQVEEAEEMSQSLGDLVMNLKGVQHHAQQQQQQPQPQDDDKAKKKGSMNDIDGDDDDDEVKIEEDVDDSLRSSIRSISSVRTDEELELNHRRRRSQSYEERDNNNIKEVIELRQKVKDLEEQLTEVRKENENTQAPTPPPPKNKRVPTTPPSSPTQADNSILHQSQSSSSRTLVTELELDITLKNSVIHQLNETIRKQQQTSENTHNELETIRTQFEELKKDSDLKSEADAVRIHYLEGLVRDMQQALTRQVRGSGVGGGISVGVGMIGNGKIGTGGPGGGGGGGSGEVMIDMGSVGVLSPMEAAASAVRTNVVSSSSSPTNASTSTSPPPPPSLYSTPTNDASETTLMMRPSMEVSTTAANNSNNQRMQDQIVALANALEHSERKRAELIDEFRMERHVYASRLHDLNDRLKRMHGSP